MPRIIVFDTETTGLLKPKRVPLEHQPKIIEIGAVVIENTKGGKGVIIEKVSQLLDPKEPISEVITKITGITNDDLKGQPSFAEYHPYLKQVFAGSDAIICHNAPFDVAMLGNELNRLGTEVNRAFPWPPQIICTVREFHHKFGFNPNLQLLYKTVMGKELEQTHRAVDDAVALTDIIFETGFEKFI